MQPHANSGAERNFLLAISLTALTLIAELLGGLWTGSLALLSDSAHVFMDIFALGLSYLALRLSALPADDRHTYGYHRLEVLAALVNGLALVGISIGIFVEAYQRWQTPYEVKSLEMLVIAVIGLIVNLAVAVILNGGVHTHDHDKDGDSPAGRDLNLRSAFLHVVGDAISSVGVILAAIIISVSGWEWMDPLMSFLIGLIILVGSYRVLRSSLHILIEGVPEGMHLSRVVAAMLDVAGVLEVHDLHIWNICSGTVALSAHVVYAPEQESDQARLMAKLKQSLAQKFGIEHTTIQFECAACGQGQSALYDREKRLPLTGPVHGD